MVSIIVPIYNVEKYLKKCIDSLLAQTYRDIEIILVDDGSPDKCGDICDYYATIDPRVIVIHQPNSGVSAARNSGLEIARGQYIGFCDPDDFVEPSMYEQMVHAMEKYDVEMVACGYNYYFENYNIDESRPYPQKKDELMNRKEVFSKLADMPPTIRHGVCTKLFLKNNLVQMRFKTDLHSAEDADFLLNYIRKIRNAVFIHLPLYDNLIRNGSATHGGLNAASLKDSFAVHNRMYEETVMQFPDLRNKSIAFLMDVCTLKYNEAKQKTSYSSLPDAEILQYMRKFLQRKSLIAVFSNNIMWKTKIYYLLLWFRK